MSKRLIDANELISAMYYYEHNEGRLTAYDAQDIINEAPTIEPNLILPERMERGDIYEVGETIVVMNHDDYYDLLCKSWEPKRGAWEEKETFHNADDNPIIEEWQSARCSVCNKYHTTPYMYYFDNYNFCPNCGASMREREGE